jgi:hypothetical protein
MAIPKKRIAECGIIPHVPQPKKIKNFKIFLINCGIKKSGNSAAELKNI